MATKNRGGWSDTADAPLNNPFAALRPPGSVATPAPEVHAAPTPTASARPNRAVVRVERKGRGGKTVTVVELPGADEATAERLGADLRKKLGCGGATEGTTVLVQGDHRERVAEALKALGVAKVSVG